MNYRSDNKMPGRHWEPRVATSRAASQSVGNQEMAFVLPQLRQTTEHQQSPTPTGGGRQMMPLNRTSNEPHAWVFL